MSETEARCGFEYEVAAIEDVGSACCWRPVWNGRERCVWHANESEKPREALERDRPRPDERLDGAVLRGVSLSGVPWLRDCSLLGADFTDATVSGADFANADLRRATFRDVNAHGTTFAGADLEDAVFVYADLRGVDFEDTRLYRAFLTDVRVNQETHFGDRVVYERELEAADTPEDALVRTESAIWTYRELQGLFEENADPRRVIRYFVREMDLRRRRAWRTRDYLSIVRLEGARWIMRYGISPWRVVAASALVIVGAALLFPVTGGIQETGNGAPLTYRVGDPTQATPSWALRVLFRSLYFSVVTFATLGYGDIQPLGGWARAIAALESLVGTLLMALLVFVLTWRIR